MPAEEKKPERRSDKAGVAALIDILNRGYKPPATVGKRIGKSTSPSSTICIEQIDDAPPSASAFVRQNVPMPKRSYVYAIDVDGVRRYIGKGTNGRVYHHMKEVRQRLTRPFKLRNVTPIFQRKLTEAVMKGAVVQEIVLADNLTSKSAHKLEYHQLKRMVDDGKRHDLWNVIPQSICTPQEYDAYLKKLTANATSKDRLTRALARMQLMRLGKDVPPAAGTSRLAR